MPRERILARLAIAFIFAASLPPALAGCSRAQDGGAGDSQNGRGVDPNVAVTFAPPVRLGDAPATGQIAATITDFRKGEPTEQSRDPRLFTLVVENGTPAPVYVYRRWIRIFNEPAEHRLRLEQHERPYVNTGSSADCHPMTPAYVRVEPRERLGLPQMVSFEYDQGTASGIEHVKITASELVVELGWSDRPLEWDGKGCNVERAQQLVALERGVVTSRLAL
jgi:hypothetical protein